MITESFSSKRGRLYMEVSDKGIPSLVQVLPEVPPIVSGFSPLEILAPVNIEKKDGEVYIYFPAARPVTKVSRRYTQSDLLMVLKAVKTANESSLYHGSIDDSLVWHDGRLKLLGPFYSIPKPDLESAKRLVIKSDFDRAKRDDAAKAMTWDELHLALSIPSNRTPAMVLAVIIVCILASVLALLPPAEKVSPEFLAIASVYSVGNLEQKGEYYFFDNKTDGKEKPLLYFPENFKTMSMLYFAATVSESTGKDVLVLRSIAKLNVTVFDGVHGWESVAKDNGIRWRLENETVVFDNPFTL